MDASSLARRLSRRRTRSPLKLGELTGEEYETNIAEGREGGKKTRKKPFDGRLRRPSNGLHFLASTSITWTRFLEAL
jgi:hypothetical protein